MENTREAGKYRLSKGKLGTAVQALERRESQSPAPKFSQMGTLEAETAITKETKTGWKKNIGRLLLLLLLLQDVHVGNMFCFLINYSNYKMFHFCNDCN